MVELRLLGSLDLSGDPQHNDATALLAKPKLTALLVYLLLARPEGWYRRDELAALFWPESDQAHARRALSQAIYQLRQHLGPGAIEGRGKEDLRLTDGVVRCDVLEVRQAVDEGRWEDAVRAYSGDLLPAFHLPDDGDFASWLDAERQSLRRTVADASLNAARKAQREGETEAARRWFARAVVVEPLDRDRVAASMAGMAETGDAKAALGVFEKYRIALAKDLELEPDSELIALAETIRQSHRLPPVRLGAPIPDSIPPTLGSIPSEQLTRHTSRRGPGRLTTAFATVAGVVLLALLLAPMATKPVALDPGLVAVLPFGYEGPESDDPWLASALPVGLAPLLDGTAGLEAVSEQRVGLALAAERKSWHSELSADEARTIARAVGAGSYLTATVVSDGENQRVLAALTDTESGEELQRVQFPVDTLDLNHTIDRLVVELLIAVAGQFRQSNELLSHSPAALRSYVDGWVARREQRHLDALRHFHRAMDLDTTFALAALAYREVSIWLPDGTPHRLALERADSMVRRFPDRLSEADRAVSDAIFYTHRLTENGAEALEGIRRATLIAPDRPSAWLLLGDFLLHDGRMLDIPNHVDLAAAALDSARALGDITPEAERHLIEIRLAERDTAFAREYLAGHQRDPEAFSHLWWVAASLVGDSEQLADFDEVLDREPASTWRWMVLWSQRAETGFAQADRAADLLGASKSVDKSVQRGNRYILLHYQLNRGRPRKALHPVGRTSDPPLTRFNGAAPYPEAVLRLEYALASPQGWLDLEAAVTDVQREYPDYQQASRLPAACGLGLWHAQRGEPSEAEQWASAMDAWHDDANLRMRSYALACPHVIRAALDAAENWPALRAIGVFLRDEPPGTLRHDITRWNLYVSDIYRDKGMPNLGLPMTTRLGYVVESSSWLTPALLREGKLSLLTGDTARAAVAYARVARLLSAPEPEIVPLAEDVRLTAERLLAWVSRGPRRN